MSNLPSGWIPNMPAPETLAKPYTGDPTPGWEAGPGGAPGPQPRSANNPDGTYPGVPVMGMNGEAWASLSGPPPQGSPDHAGKHVIDGKNG